ncbi:barstar family protein [Amycolatopsis sp. NPDC059027]|uniref:barstar family protein n=1 Tax=unclassified Amycolatopsis TaxID=2618356 RepID=UPI00366B3AA4
MSTVELDGTRVHNNADFHRELSRLLDFGPYYGHNLSALWDRLSRDVERPVHLVWRDAEASKAALGDSPFDAILRILEDAAEEDRHSPHPERFTYELA